MTDYRYGTFTEADARKINHQRVTITTHAEHEAGQPAQRLGPRYAFHVPGKPYLMLVTAEPTEANLEALLSGAIVVFLVDIATVTVHRSASEDARDGAAIVLHPDGTVGRVELPGETAGQLTVMYKALDCERVDVVRLSDRINMWLDDDGVDTRPVNPIATALARRYGFTFQDYHGPAMLTGVDVSTGTTLNLTADQAKALRATITEITRSLGS